MCMNKTSSLSRLHGQASRLLLPGVCVCVCGRGELVSLGRRALQYGLLGGCPDSYLLLLRGRNF